MKKILFFAGSTRKGSFNKKLAQNAQKIADEIGGVKTTLIDLADYQMPIYDGDLEDKSGLPDNAKKLKKLVIEHDAVFIAAPEYNSSISGVLKNSIDWISRKSEKDEKDLIAFQNKIAAISSASPGALGGLRGLVPLRMLLGNIRVTVIPSQFALSAADKAFDDKDNLKAEFRKPLENVVNELVSMVKKS